MEPLNQAGILDHTCPVNRRFIFISEDDLILLDLNLSDFSVFGHRHEGTVVHILYSFPRNIWGNEAVEYKDCENHRHIKIN